MRLLLSFAAGLLWLVPSQGSAGAEAAGEGSFSDLVAAYRQDREGAAVALALFGDGVIEHEVEQMGNVLASLPAEAANPTRLAAATLLADGALREEHAGRFARSLSLLLSAVRLLEQAPPHPDVLAFERRFYLLAGLALHSSADLEPAHTVLEKGLRIAPKDPELLTAFGATIETVVALRRYARSPDSPGGPGQPGGYGTETGNQGAVAGATLKAAEARFSEALALAPYLVEARLRRGRVRLLQGRTGPALEDLDRVAADTGRAETRYLARLFAGRALETKGELAEARDAYRAANEEAPRAQTALMALARAHDRLGDVAEAQEALAGAGTVGDPGDPWWDYQAGEPDRLAGLLVELQRLLR
jgi:tetratricopeptide (TPR) repeat protein